jgi:hypothetical protein
MASYVIHDVAGKKFLENINATEREQSGFLLGNLIVDSSIIFGNETNPEKRKQIKEKYGNEIQNEKIETHFRRKEDFENNIQLCNLKAFLEKYGKYMDNPAVLGYFFHLYTDNRFFKDVFDGAFTCLNDKGEKTELWSETTQYKILKNNNIVTPKKFWTEENIYGDYTKMNKLVLNYYGINFDEKVLRDGFKLYKNPGISEVNFENIESVIIETKSYIEDSESSNENDLKVFDSSKIIEFIDEVGKDFEEQYPQYVKKIKR